MLFDMFDADKDYEEYSIRFYNITNYEIDEYYKNLDKMNMQIIQNEVNRLLVGVRKSDKIPTRQLQEMTGLLSINQIAVTQLLIETRNILVHDSVPGLKETLLGHKKEQTDKTRSAQDGKLELPLCHRNMDRGFVYYAAKAWNSAPKDLRDLTLSLPRFKKLTKEYVRTLP